MTAKNIAFGDIADHCRTGTGQIFHRRRIHVIGSLRQLNREDDIGATFIEEEKAVAQS